MADYAHNETDKRIAELEKRLSEEYRQAYKETKDKLEKYLSDFKRKDEEKRQEVENGTLSEKDYKTWRRNQMLMGQRWADMVDTLARDLSNVNVIAAQIVKNELSDTFILNANYSEYCIEEGFRTDYGFTLYNRDTVNKLISENPDLLPEPSVDIPADLRWNKQKIVSNITQAVLQGKSIPEIAKSMETVVGMNKASAVRNARTAMTGAQNAGRQQAYERAEAMGIRLQKEWIATLDGRTRHSHGMADGQKVDINGMFKVGGCKMRYPGDVANGTAEEIYNCRCTMATVEPPEIMQGDGERMTYSEWVQTKEGQEATGGKYVGSSLDNGEKKNTTVSPSKISNNISSKKQTNFKTKSELEQMSIAQLRKETANLAKTWYKSGKSGISFGDKDIDAAVSKLVNNANRNSLTKDYMSLKKKVAALDNGSGSGIINNKEKFATLSDPMKEVLGAAERSHPDEIKKLTEHIHSLGARLERPDHEDLNYQPGLSCGQPGIVSISKGASYSAWLHEVKHLDDDYADGFLGFRVFQDAEKCIKREIDAYQIEIDMARSLGREDIVKRLEALRDDEIKKYR